MPTTHQRINLTVPPHLGSVLQRLAKRDNMAMAKKTLQLVEQALEIEEDRYFDKIAMEREKQGGRLIPHEQAWM